VTWQISIVKWLCHIVSLLPWVLILSFVCHFALTHWLGSLFSEIEYHLHPQVIVQTLWFSLLLFGLFQLPIWIALRHASVAQLLHNSQSKAGKMMSLMCVLLVLITVAAGYSDNGLLTTMLLGTMALSILLMLLISWLVMTLGEKLTQRLSGLLPFTLYMMKQRLLSKTTQILGVGLCAFLLLFTLMFMGDLGNTLSAYKRQHDGNLLVTQATEEQWQAIETLSNQHNIEIRQHKPFVYAQMTQINGVSLKDHTDKPSDSLATLQDSIRLHWSEAIPENNQLVQGTWWSAGTEHWQQVSIEDEIMTDLGLQIGDQLTLVIAGQAYDFTLSASHQYRPGAGSITFWVQMPKSALAYIKAPHYAMASLEVDDQNLRYLTSLWQSHPSLRITSIKEMTERFDKMLALVIQVVSGFAVLISLLAVIVILSSVHGSLRSEKRKNSIILSFGFKPSTCLKLYVWEWLITAFIAACGAILGTWLAGILIYQSQFSMSYQPEPAWLLTTLAIILFVVITLGVLASKRSLSRSVRMLLAE
jgi:predicted lysophospholipase L1 biosynthesis ABC-type transport system permease subunit